MAQRLLASKSIPIADLPDGYTKKQLQRISLNEQVKVNVVATGGHANDWAAYIGFPSWVHEVKPEHRTREMYYYCEEVSSVIGVMQHGDKLSMQEAITLFPEFSHLRYRS